MKKWIAIGILLMVISLNAHGQEGDKPSSWAKEDVGYVLELGLVPERLQNQYTKAITREEYAQLALNTLLYVTKADPEKIMQVIVMEEPFTDAKEDYIYGAYNVGIINGVSATHFKPNQPITRQEAAVMMANMMISVAAEVDKAPSHFRDEENIMPWANEAVDICFNAGIFKGTSIGFEPLAYYTREQAMVTMKKFIDHRPSSPYVSLRGKVLVKIDNIDDIRVGSRWVKLGSYKDKKQYTHLINKIENMSQQTKSRLLAAKESVTLQDQELNFKTYGEDFLISISW